MRRNKERKETRRNRGKEEARSSNRWHQKFIRDARYRLRRTAVSGDRSPLLIVTPNGPRHSRYRPPVNRALSRRTVFSFDRV